LPLDNILRAARIIVEGAQESPIRLLEKIYLLLSLTFDFVTPFIKTRVDASAIQNYSVLREKCRGIRH